MPICAFDIADDGTAVAVVDLSRAQKGYRWVHFDRADDALDAWVAQNVPELPGQALLQAETRPRCDRQDGGLILNLRGVNLNKDGPADQMVSVRLWVCAQTIVTVRVRKVFALDALRKNCEAGQAPTSVSAFLLQLSQGLNARVQDVVFDLADRVEEIEETHLSTRILPDHIGELRRQAIRLHRYMSPQRTALGRLTDAVGEMFGDAAHQREVSNLTTLHVEELEALKGRLAAIQDQHDSHVSAAQNSHGHVLSIVAAVFLPLGFLTGLFGVNVAGMPGLETPQAFLLLCVGMLVSAVAVLVFLLKKAWI
jgi:zinc transporter